MAARTLSTVDPRILEGTAVLATAIGHLTWGMLDLPRAPFVFAAVGGWAAYVGWRASQDRGVLREWGFRRDNFREAWRPAVAIGVPVALGMLAIGLFRGNVPLPWTAALGLVVYPIWGVIQQFLVQGLVSDNLDRLLPSAGVSAPSQRLAIVTAVSATLFGLVHYPHPVLMGATFLLGLVFTPMYLRYRNLYVLGLWHGWLGTLLYYAVLGRDPLVGFFPG